MPLEREITQTPVCKDELLEKLGQVLDPELDESILERGFIESLQIQEGSVTVELRLPTFWCAAAFAYLMAENIRQRLLAIHGVTAVTVRLKDHFESQAIEAAVNAGKRFSQAFPGEAGEGLDDLRLLFLRKGFIKRQEQFVRSLTDAGLSLQEISGLRVEHLTIEGRFCRVRRPSGDALSVEAGQAAQRYFERRAELGLNCSPTASLITDSEDRPIPAHRLKRHLREARTVRLSLEANAAVCSALLDARKAEAPGAFVQIGGQHVSG